MKPTIKKCVFVLYLLIAVMYLTPQGQTLAQSVAPEVLYEAQLRFTGDTLVFREGALRSRQEFRDSLHAVIRRWAEQYAEPLVFDSKPPCHSVLFLGITILRTDSTIQKCISYDSTKTADLAHRVSDAICEWWVGDPTPREVAPRLEDFELAVYLIPIPDRNEFLLKAVIPDRIFARDIFFMALASVLTNMKGLYDLDAFSYVDADEVTVDWRLVCYINHSADGALVMFHPEFAYISKAFESYFLEQRVNVRLISAYPK